MKGIVILLLSLTICGCTYHSQTTDPVTPLTYKVALNRRADSVGKLRRLVLMPVEIKPFRGKYPSVKDREDAARRIQDACGHFLTEKKGYEVVVVGNKDGQWQSDRIEHSEHGSFRDLYKKWYSERTGNHSASVIQKIGAAFNVDGVLAIRIKEPKPWGVTEGLLNIAFMNLPLFYSIASPNVGAWIYETATGRLVWREEHSSFGNAASASDSSFNSLTGLFSDLENAVPRQLIQ